MSDPSLRRYDLDWIRIGAFFLLIELVEPAKDAAH